MSIVLNITLLQLLIIAFLGWLIVDIVTIFTKNAMLSLHLDYRNTFDSGMIVLLLISIFLVLVLVWNTTQAQVDFNLSPPTTTVQPIIPISKNVFVPYTKDSKNKKGND